MPDDLPARIRPLLESEGSLSERAMFGGLAFLIAGNMAVAVRPSGGLLVRTGPQAAVQAAEGEPHAEVARMGNRVMRGWVHVEPAGLRSDADLARWVARGAATARGLPPK